MQSISTPAALKSSFRLEVLEPFGLKIIGSGKEKLSSIDVGFLDRLLKHEKLVLLRQFSPMGREEFLEYCGNYPGKELLRWNFGPVMEMKEEPNPKNYLFSREKVPFHWDGAFHQVPAYLVFNCVLAPVPGAGGETLFCDTERIWDDATVEERANWQAIELSYETAKLAHYGGSIRGPLVQAHPTTGRTILRFAEPVATVLNPVTLKISGLSEDAGFEFLKKMEENIYSPNYCYKHVWKEGDFLIADNHALIHGRHAFKADCPRHLRRIQLI